MDFKPIDCKYFNICNENCRYCIPSESPCFKLYSQKDKYEEVLNFISEIIEKSKQNLDETFLEIKEYRK